MKFTRDTNRANLWVGLSRYMERFRQLLEICPSVSNDPGSLTHPQLSFLTLTVLLVHGEELSTMDVLPTEVMCACLVAKSFWLIVTPWIIVSQAPLSVGFSRQEYWSGLPLAPPGDLPSPETEPVSQASSALAGRFFTPETLGSPFLREL